MHSINKSKLFNKVFINVFVISIFVVFFFFTYGVYIEKKLFINQIVILAKYIKNYLNLFGKKIEDVISNEEELYKEVLYNLSNEDINVTKNNNNLKLKSFISLIVFLFCILLIIYFNYTIFAKNSYKLNNIIYESILIIFFVSLTYFVFFTYCSYRFITINPNIIKLSILESLKE